MKGEPALIAAAGWHGIGQLTPDALALALVFVALLITIGITLAIRCDGEAPGGSTDTHPRGH